MLMEKPKQEFFLSVHMLRGIASFLVLLCHSPKGYEAQHHTFWAFFNSLGFGVNTFLVISGFIIPYSMYKANYQFSDFKFFMFKRLVRLEPPYIASIIMILILNYVNTLYPWYHGGPYIINWPFVFGHLAYVNAFTGAHWLNWAYWTLAVEFQFYMVLSLIFPLLNSNNKKTMFAAFFGLLAISWIIVPGRPYIIFVYLPLFLMGISLFLHMTGKTTVKEFFIMLVPTYIVFCIVQSYLGRNFTGTPFMMLGGIAALPVIYYVKKAPKFLLWLGTISYSMYLTHMPLTTRFIQLYEKYLHMNFYFAWFFCVVSCVIFAWLFYLAVEKPFLALSKKIKIHKPA
jgi:peptidoglycan/LPS O-acetylase OafA/YrhL